MRGKWAASRWRHVYFMRDRASGAIKIGMSSNPPKRLTALRCELKLDIELLGWCNSGPRVEGALHRWFAADRIRGEWFTATDELWDLIVECVDANRVPERIMKGRSAQ